MTPEAQRIAIAEACGWTGPFKNECLPKRSENFWELVGTRPNGGRDIVPNYLTDLNAMHEAEKAIPKKDRQRYATAAQRAEAFLRTLNRWVE